MADIERFRRANRCEGGTNLHPNRSTFNKTLERTDRGWPGLAHSDRVARKGNDITIHISLIKGSQFLIEEEKIGNFNDTGHKNTQLYSAECFLGRGPNVS
jgi:hypothetical protein